MSKKWIPETREAAGHMDDEPETIQQLRAECKRLSMTLEAAQAALHDVIQDNTYTVTQRDAARAWAAAWKAKAKQQRARRRAGAGMAGARQAVRAAD